MRLIALLIALFAFPAQAQTFQPQYYAVAIADTGGIGGVISYRIGADGKLDGRYALHKGDGRIEHEIATPRRSGGLAGTYNTKGAMQGEAYAGVLTITLIAPVSEGELYRVRWDNGDQGIGLRNGSTLTVAFGGGADTVGMLASTVPDEWTVTGIGWRNGGEHRVGLGWTGMLRGNPFVSPIGGGPYERLLIEPVGTTWHLFFDDGSFGVAMPVTAPPLKG